MGWGSSRVNLLELSCYELHECPKLYREVMFAKTPPHGVGSILKSNFFAMIVIKCQDLCRKVMFPSPYLQVRVQVEEEEVSLQKSWELNDVSRSSHKIVFSKSLPPWGWGSIYKNSSFLEIE